MAHGVNARLQFMLAQAPYVHLHTHEHAGKMFATIEIDGNGFTLSGPAARISATLRELADIVDADARQAIA